MQQRGDARLGALRHDGAGDALPRLQQLEAGCAFQALGLGGQVLGNLMLRLGDEFGGGRGRGSAEIGNEVGDGEVGFMTYR